MSSAPETERVEQLEASREELYRVTLRLAAHLLIAAEKTALQAAEEVPDVHYRFELIRASDGFQVIEDSDEVYALAKRDGRWETTPNIDHYQEASA